MTYKLDSGQQWLRDETSNELVGIQDSIDGEQRGVLFTELDGVLTVVKLSQAEYEAITTPVATTLYVIV
jgi:hypothetical protein